VLVTPIAEILPDFIEREIIPEAEAQVVNQPPVILSVNGIIPTLGQDIELVPVVEGETIVVETNVYDPDGDSTESKETKGVEIADYGSANAF